MAEEKNELLVLGNFVGRLLEAFPNDIKSKALKEIEKAEQRYCLKFEETYGMRPMLAPQLWQIELSKSVAALDPDMNGEGIATGFGETIESHLASLPLELRAGILEKICSIVSNYGDTIQNKDKNKDKSEDKIEDENKDNGDKK